MTYLVFNDLQSAKQADDKVMAHLRETDGSTGSQWSGVFTDGKQFGILWDAPVAAVFGSPDEHQELVLAEGEWELAVEVKQPEQEEI